MVSRLCCLVGNRKFDKATESDPPILGGGFNFLSSVSLDVVPAARQAELFVLPCRWLTRFRPICGHGHQLDALIAQPIMSLSITCVGHRDVVGPRFE